MRTCTLVSARPLLVQEYRLRDISGWPTPQGWAHYTEKRQGLRCLNGLMSGLVAFQCLIQPFDQLADLRLLCAERAVLLVTAGQHFVKHCVARPRADDSVSRLVQFMDSRCDDGAIFRTQNPVFTRMRI